jgi:hypothetical protein
MKLKSIVQHSLMGFVLLCQCAILLEHFHFYSVQKASQAQGLNSMVSRDRTTSSLLYGIDLAGDLKGKDFPVGT